MYIATIKTKFNVIRMEVEDVNSDEFQEVINQPDVQEVRIDRKTTLDELKEERDKALWHVVGTNYWNEKAQELTRKMKEV